jgi:hypothetical protein
MHLTEGELSWGVGIVAISAKTQATVSQITATERVTTAGAGDSVLRARIIERVKQLVSTSREPVNMASAAWDIIRNEGQEVVDSQWAGAGSFKELLLSVDMLGFNIFTAPGQPGLLYDPQRHTLPSSSILSDRMRGLPTDLATFASRINRVTGTPLLSPAEYTLVFNVLEEELKKNNYFLSATSKAVRDRCIERGSSIPRRAVNFILQGIVYAGHTYEENPLADTANNFAKSFKENVCTLCKNAQLILSDEELVLLDNWIQEESPQNERE